MSAPLGGGDIVGREFEPLAILPPVGKPTVPIALDTDWIVGFDGVHDSEDLMPVSASKRAMPRGRPSFCWAVRLISAMM